MAEMRRHACSSFAASSTTSRRVENRTARDGSDLGLHLARLFDVLNTPPEERQRNLDETLAAFPYVNGELFAENLRFADFNFDMRNALLACARFDWSRISPAIFGSLFQAVMEPRLRRQINDDVVVVSDTVDLDGPADTAASDSEILAASRIQPLQTGKVAAFP